MASLRRAAALGAAAFASSAAAISVDLTSESSIKSATSIIADGLMSYYTGNDSGGTPGILPSPYYWWEAGAMFGAMMDYWYYTGDDTYNDEVSQAMLFQVSSTYDFMPANQTKDEGNDDQVFWGFSAMTAAEYNFTNPPSDEPSWLTMAEAVFNSQAERWDNDTCNGGLHWQIYTFNNGYNYKNAPSNMGFINLGARLYAYTDNESYVPWVESGWNWMYGVGIISTDYIIYDGVSTPDNCSTVDHDQWTYSTGMAINTAIVMWNKTGSDVWKERAVAVWNGSSTLFFNDDKIMLEGCEATKDCDTDQLSFKSYFARYLAASVKWAPWFWDYVEAYLTASATAAAAQCIGGTSGTECGTVWTDGAVWDGTTGVGQQMCAMQIINAMLIQDVGSPLSESTGGTSTGNATYGTGGDSDPAEPQTTIDTADRAGAGIVTVMVVVSMLGGAWWLVS